MCSDAPDTRIAQEAALRNVELSKEALDWFKQTYEEGAQDRKDAASAAREQSGLQRDLTLQSMATQKAQSDRYNNTFAPVEDRIVTNAMGYDTPERREAAAGQAMADVDSQIALGRTAADNEMAARGVDPSSGAYALSMARQAIQGAALKAAEGNKARTNVETVGNARMMDAAGVGRGVISNQATQAQIGLNAGNSSVANANMPNQINMQGATMGAQGYQTAMQGNQSAGQLSLGAANAQAGVDASNSQTAAGAGAAVGAIAIAI